MGINIDGARDLVSAADGSLTIEGQSINTTGIVTATGGFKVGTAATISSNGNATFSGIVTSTQLNSTGDLTVDGTTFFVDQSTAKIGIGTAPARTFQVFAATPQVNIKSASAGTCELQFGDTADEVRANIIYNSSSNYLGFNGYNNTERMRIESGGRVNIVGIASAAGGFVVGTAATIYSNGNATFSGISTFVRASLTGSSESLITTQAATAGGTTTLDMNTSDNWIITMGGNTTINGPNNAKVGQTGSIWLVQDGTGSRTAAWHSNWKWVGGTAPTLTTTASMIDRVDYVVKAAAELNAVISLDVK